MTKAKRNNKNNGATPAAYNGRTVKSRYPSIASHLGRQTTRIKRTEPLAPLVCPDDPYWTNVWTVNPGVSSPATPRDGVFTWLNSVAPGWDMYRIDYLAFHYVPQVGTTQEGSIVMMFDPDVADNVPTNDSNGFQAAEEHQFSECTPVYQGRTLVVDLQGHYKALGRDHPFRKVRQHAIGDSNPFSEYSSYADYDVGTFAVSMANPDQNLHTFGRLFVEYDVTFMVTTPDDEINSYAVSAGCGTLVSGQSVLDDTRGLEPLVGRIPATLGDAVFSIPTSTQFKIAETAQSLFKAVKPYFKITTYTDRAGAAGNTGWYSLASSLGGTIATLVSKNYAQGFSFTDYVIEGIAGEAFEAVAAHPAWIGYAASAVQVVGPLLSLLSEEGKLAEHHLTMYLAGLNFVGAELAGDEEYAEKYLVDVNQWFIQCRTAIDAAMALESEGFKGVQWPGIREYTELLPEHVLETAADFVQRYAASPPLLKGDGTFQVVDVRDYLSNEDQGWVKCPPKDSPASSSSAGGIGRPRRAGQGSVRLTNR